MTTYHIHHIVPRHAGGTNDPENLVRVTIEEHAELHFARYLQYGELGDWLAAFSLSGQISNSEAAHLARMDWISKNASRMGAVGGKARCPEHVKVIAAGLAAQLGKKPWWNNGLNNKRSHTCPGEGYVRGKLPHKKNLKSTL